MSVESSVSNETEPTQVKTVVAPEAVESAETPNVSEVNERLLAESKKYKKAAQEYKQQLETMANAKLQEEAKYKELWQKSDEKYQNLYKSLVREKVKAAVTERATKAGAVDVEAVLALGNKELLQVDEESLDVLGTDTFVEELKKQKPYLFQTAQKAPTINATTPGGVVAQKKQATLHELAVRKMTDPDKKAAWMTAFGQKK